MYNKCLHYNNPYPKLNACDNGELNQSGSNDFVKKLFLMLQEDSYKEVVRWTAKGDSFVVINTNEFTKDILPKAFQALKLCQFCTSVEQV